MSNGIGDYTKYIVGDEGFLIDTSNPGSAALDLGITALALTGVGAIPAAVLKAGVKGKKAKKLIDQAKKKSKERLSNAAAADIMTSIGEVAGEGIMGVEGLAMGGIAQLKDGGDPSLIRSTLNKLFGKTKIGKILRIGDKIKDSKKNSFYSLSFNNSTNLLSISLSIRSLDLLSLVSTTSLNKDTERPNNSKERTRLASLSADCDSLYSCSMT